MDVKLPHLGEDADSGTVVNVFVKEGERVEQDQALIELENEKAVASIPSTASGVVSKVYVKTGDKVSVGQRILTLSEGERAEGEKAPAKPKTAAEKKESTQSETEEASAEEPEEKESEGEPNATGAIAASPSIRKVARDLGIDLARIRGSGGGGRIEMADLRGYIQRLQKLAAQSKPAAPATVKPTAEQIDFSKWGEISKKPLSPLRQVIARRMTENWNTIPHVTQFDEADITTILTLRKQHLSTYEQKGARLTVTSFVLKAVADTLKKHPIFNSSLDEAANEIVLKEYFHIGIAVDTEAGLIVPVMRNVDKKNLADISKELEELAKKARDRKISADELKGGTFTISNQGGIGGAHFTPIINKPEVAILGLGKATMKAVVRESMVEPRMMMPLGLSYDHRVIDGGAAARFIVDLVQALEKFSEDTVKI
jgi:pyruvate dehydrogenase E2 component (dihydrolipoamide acetyltransferase)